MTSTTELLPLEYTTPTVTLAVMVRPAAVSQWSEMPIVQVLRFRLQLKTTIQEAPLEIQGDRDEFIRLTDAIQTYLQHQLTGESADSQVPAVPPYLASVGFAQHALYLGRRGFRIPPPILLGPIQLADLSTVFEQLESNVRPLPVTLAPVAQRPRWKMWGTVAASALAAVGLTTTVWTISQTAQVEHSPSNGPAVDDEADRLPRAERPAQAEPSQTAATAQVPLPERRETASLPLSETTEAAPSAAPETAADTGQKGAQPNRPSGPTTQEPAAEPEPKTAQPPSAAQAAGTGNHARDIPKIEASSDSPLTEAETARETAAETTTPALLAEPQDSSPPPVSAAARAPQRTTVPEIPTTFSIPTSPAGAPVPEEAESSAISPLDLAALETAIAQQWQPPADLSQSLVYTLVVTDGKLSDIFPADEAAACQQAQAGLPALGTPVGSPGRDRRYIEAVLTPSGPVELRLLPPAPLPPDSQRLSAAEC